jgi:F-type H+-transporting ATPase subunit b
MNADSSHDAVESVPGVPDVLAQSPTDVLAISDKMMLLTWITFIIAAVCLHKLLWKPILRMVEKREKDIGDALQGAADARQERSDAEDSRRQILRQTEQDARVTTEAATRQAAAIVARADADARVAAQRRVAEAERVIQGEYRKAFETLRHNAADNISKTVEKLIRQNLTDEQKRAYHEEMLREVQL